MGRVKPKTSVRSSAFHSPFRCPRAVFGSTFDTSRYLSCHVKQIHLNRHQRRKHGPMNIPCPVDGCPAIITTDEALQFHQRQVHGPKDVVCPHDGCDAKFGIKNDLEQHLRQRHSPKVVKLKAFDCPLVFCDKSYTTPSDLKRHLRISHTPNVIVPDAFQCTVELVTPVLSAN